MPNNFEDTLFGSSKNFLQKQGLDISGGVKDLFILFLREFFSQQKEYVWREDPNETDIVIRDTFPQDSENVQEYPRVVVNRGSVTNSNLTMGDELEPILGDVIKGKDRKMSDLFRTTIRFSCAAKEGVEAGRIATMVYVAIFCFRYILYRQGLHKIRTLSLGEESSLERDSEIVAQLVPVNLQCSMQYKWTLTKDAPTLEKIDTSMVYMDEESLDSHDFTVRSDIEE